MALDPDVEFDEGYQRGYYDAMATNIERPRDADGIPIYFGDTLKRISDERVCVCVGYSYRLNGSVQISISDDCSSNDYREINILQDPTNFDHYFPPVYERIRMWITGTKFCIENNKPIKFDVLEQIADELEKTDE